MSKPPRCHECRHRKGRRVLAYRKTKGQPDNPLVIRKQHKYPCDCDCHTPSSAQYERGETK